MWFLSGVASAHIPVLVFAGPTDDWCGVFRDASQGDVVLLAPGDYTGPCDLVGKPPDPKYPTEYSVLAAQDSSDRPRFHWDGAAPYILSVAGEQVQVAWLEFPSIPAGVSALEVRESRALWILDNSFSAVAGTAVTTLDRVDLLRLSELVVAGGGGTGLAIGCAGCSTTGLIVQSQLFTGLSTGMKAVDAEGQVGEVVADGGVGLDLAGTLVVEEALIRGEVVLRGPVVVQSSIVVGKLSSVAGTSGVRLYGNTFFAEGGAPLDLAGWDASSALQDNAISGEVPVVDGSSGNVGCPDPAACWRSPATLDLYPKACGPLTEGTVVPDAGFLFTDWCGFARQDPITAGALESLDAPIPPLRFDLSKSFESCAPIEIQDTGCGPADTDTEPKPDTDPTGDNPADGGESCGCRTSGRGGVVPAAGVVVLGIAMLLRRSRAWGCNFDVTVERIDAASQGT